MKLVIGNKNYSSWSLRAWLFLTWHGVEFDEVRVPLFEPGYKAKLLAYSGAGQGPVLLDDEVQVWDSLAICEYVSEQYLSGRGWPDNVAQRAEARSVSAEMHAGFSVIRNQLPMNVRALHRQVARNHDLEAEINRIDQLWSDLRNRHYADGPWLFGGFSIADCLYAPMAFRFNTYGVRLNGRAGVYLQTLLDAPAMQQWLKAAQDEKEVIAMAEVGLAANEGG